MSSGAFLSFGCHTITGGSSLRQSIRLIHCAIDHGIRRFDVAASYGLGTAEKVLGKALRQQSSAEVTTKFGIEPKRFGKLLVWGREPYRRLVRSRKQSDETSPSWMGESSRRQQQAPGQNANKNNLHTRSPKAYLGLRRSLERSLRALRLESVDTLLTHERLDSARVQEHFRELDQARRDGLLKWFGASGEGEIAAGICSEFGARAQVIQVSVEEASRFGEAQRLRCFGIVRHLAGWIADLAGQNRQYQEELLSVLSDVGAPQERFALAAIAAAHGVFPQAILVVTSSAEDHIANIVRYLGEPTLLNWATAHRALHEPFVTREYGISLLAKC